MSATSSTLEWTLSNGSVVFEAIGILAFAVSGLFVAMQKKLDLVGMAMVAAFAAFGGGTLRDVLLDRRPFFWVKEPTWIYVILGLCIVALFFLRQRHIEVTAKAIQWADAIGLGIFAAGGTQIALDTKMPAIIAVIMGVFTAIFGGVLRDISVGQIPGAFNDHQPYSVLAFVGSWIVVLGNSLNWGSAVSVYLAALVIIGLRVVAVLLGWRLPSWRNAG